MRVEEVSSWDLRPLTWRRALTSRWTRLTTVNPACCFRNVRTGVRVPVDVAFFSQPTLYVYIYIEREGEREREPAFSGVNWEYQETMGQKIGRGISRINAGQGQTHFWQNARIRKRVFQKQHLRAAFGCGCLNASVVCIHFFILYLRAYL